MGCRSGTSVAAAVSIHALVTAEQAYILGQDTLQRCRRVLGLDHPTTLWTAGNLIIPSGFVGDAKLAHALGQDMLQRCRGTGHAAALPRGFRSDHWCALWVAACVLGGAVGWGEGIAARALGQDTLQRCYSRPARRGQLLLINTCCPAGVDLPR